MKTCTRDEARFFLKVMLLTEGNDFWELAMSVILLRANSL